MSLDVILHPLRARILGHLGRRAMTTAELAEAMGDVPQATLYRHISLLQEQGIVRVASERRIRGTIERTLEVSPEAAFLPDIDEATRESLLRVAGFFGAALIGDFDRYLGAAGSDLPDLERDGVVFETFDLRLTDAEFAAFARALFAAVQQAESAASGEGRLRRLSIAIVPD